MASFRVGLLLVALATGIVATEVASGPPVTAATATPTAPAIVATATRQAELAEISALRTEVADLRTQVARLTGATATPTPAPSPTPTPVPPAAMNVPLDYLDSWTISITDVTTAGSIAGENRSVTAEGMFVVVQMMVTNNTRDQQRLELGELILVDPLDRVFEPNLEATLMATGNLTMRFPPSIPTESAIVFDVTTDAGDSFILESRSDPTFRVQLQVVQRG
jgi:hypothetical protein